VPHPLPWYKEPVGSQAATSAVRGRRPPVARPVPARPSPPVARGAGLQLLQLQRQAGNRAVALALGGGHPAMPVVQRAPATAEVRAAIARDDLTSEARPPLADMGAYAHLRGLTAADLAATVAGLTPAERSVLQAGGHGPRVGASTLLTPRVTTALRAVMATGRTATAERAVALMDDLAAGRGYEPALAGLDRTELTAVVTQVPAASLVLLVTEQQTAAAIYAPPTAATSTLGLVLADVTGGGTGHTLRSNDVIDVGHVRGTLNKRCATIYNSKGQFIAAEATRLGLPSATVAALMIVESGGTAFGAAGLPIARFENHVFDREWGSANPDVFADHFRYTSWRGSTHFFREQATDHWEACHRGQAVEWQTIELAARLASPEAAYRSASFGAGQIMGFNHTRVGFPSAVAMVEAFNESERAQVSAILSFISASAALLGHARAGRFLPIATAYNGSGQAASYAAKIGEFHTAYDRLTTGMEHHVP
jgi:hypothetical protein